MSRTLKKKKHWSGKVVDCAVSWGNLGDFGSVVEVLGGAEVGQFPHLGQMKLDVLVCHVGKLPYYGDVLLEVNGTPVSGLTNRDTLAVIRHFREPIRLKTVKPGAFPSYVTWAPDGKAPWYATFTWCCSLNRISLWLSCKRILPDTSRREW